jgi:hypothetical protein
MKRTAVALGFVLAMISRAWAEPSQPEATTRTYWTTCTSSESDACLVRPDSYVWPDSRFGLGATLDVVFRHTENQWFEKSGPAARIGALVTYDLKNLDIHGANPQIVGLEFGYRIEEFGASELFGETVSTAMTSHDIYAGATYKILSDRSLDPDFGFFGRFVFGVGVGDLVLRDALSGARYSSVSCAAFADLGLGVVVRLLGLLLEAGYEFAGDRVFNPPNGGRSIAVDRPGVYLRGGVVVHIP